MDPLPYKKVWIYYVIITLHVWGNTVSLAVRLELMPLKSFQLFCVIILIITRANLQSSLVAWSCFWSYNKGVWGSSGSLLYLADYFKLSYQTWPIECCVSLNCTEGSGSPQNLYQNYMVIHFGMRVSGDKQKQAWHSQKILFYPRLIGWILCIIGVSFCGCCLQIYTCFSPQYYKLQSWLKWCSEGCVNTSMC